MANSNSINDGGAAYPFVQWRSPDGMTSMHKQEGMTLRDYFAAKVLPITAEKMMMRPNSQVVEVAKLLGMTGAITVENTAATLAYSYADAMLEARKK